MQEFPVIDAHVHLDESLPGGLLAAAKALDTQLADAGVVRALVLHLDSQPWSEEEVADVLARFDRLAGYINVHPYDPAGAVRLRRGVEQLGFVGLKLHPRFQNFDIKDSRVRDLVRVAGELNIPVLIDAFPDGDWLMMGFQPLAFARLAQECPQTRIVLAHFGGHHCLDMMMLAKRIPNIYFDFSFSLLYYRGSSVVQNLLYCMQSMRYKRIFYGSDYPDRSVAETLSASHAILSASGIEFDQMRQLFFENSRAFFHWTDI